jgi:soluble lytic murein transglycosylase-like protein/Tfp pilus assembly protein PilF
MTWREVAGLVAAVVEALAAVPARAAQAPPARNVLAQAESLRLAGRPWHAAEALLAAAARAEHPNAEFIVRGARAELLARRYDRAKSLLAGQPWLEDYQDGEALEVLATAEMALSEAAPAAIHFSMAQSRSRGLRAALLAARTAVAFEAAGVPDSAARYYIMARAAGSAAADPWLRLRLARVTRDTTTALALLANLPAPAARFAAAARARALLVAGDSALALDALLQAGQLLDAARLALQLGDTARAREALYDLMARAPEADDAAAGVTLARAGLPPRLPAERVALARTLRLHGDPTAARVEVQRAVTQGDSSAATMLLYGELLVQAGRLADAERAYRAAARDSSVGPLAIYRRGRVLVRLGDPGATDALSGFAATYAGDTAAPTALYVIADLLVERGDWAGAERWFGELLARYPADLRSSLARFRLAAHAVEQSRPDSARHLYEAEVDAVGPQRNAARFWLGRLAHAQGDTASARSLWSALAREDSVGYYGLRARQLAGLPALRVGPATATAVPPAVARGLADLDTLALAGLDSEAQAQVRWLVARPPQEVDAVLAWSEGLAARGWGSVAVRLAWLAATRAPNDPRVLRAIFPWPSRAAVEAEAAEFGVDPLLLAGLVRQESVFDLEALSQAGARGLAQLLPGTAAQTARGLDVTFYPEWITVPDLNLHLGAAHLAELLARFPGRTDVAVAAYNAGVAPVSRWLARPGADDPDQFLELIPFQETRNYVRAVLRNRELYRALYAPSTN